MKPEAMKKEGYLLLKNPGGPELGYAPDTPIIEKDGLYFNDLAGTGELAPYEDWRLDPETRARDLAARLSIPQIAGLMLYSSHQMVPSFSGGPFGGTYGGKAFEESGAEPWALTDQQKQFLGEDGIRHVLAMKLRDPKTAARWNNAMQAFVEKQPYGIPVNTSSDPRHGAGEAGAEYKGGAGDVSKWPEGLGMAATFSPELCEEFARVMADEYRALGIATALSPQIDLATEPRWMRINDTFGEHPGLTADMARAYCDGLQTTEGSESGWGANSVIAMAKHWPGGGSGEGGRDAHYTYGKYAVYPGANFEEHLIPFLEGAFKLNGPTGKAGAIMPYYTVSWGQDQKDGRNVGNSYSTYIVRDLLREKYGYDGVVCTDWGITADQNPSLDAFGSRCFGVEGLSVAERHLMILMNGVDQFGGNNEAAPIIEAYRLGCERYGEAVMRERFEESAMRLLRGSFRCGLFENPYLDAGESEKVVGCEKYNAAGFAAQLCSVVMVKNRGQTLPLAEKIKVYVPERRVEATKGFFRNLEPAHAGKPVPNALLERYFTVVERPEEADAALVFITSPITDPYSPEDRAAGGNGYLPISLQYRPYTAEKARAHSIAGGDPLEDFTDRGYRGKTVRAANESDLDNVTRTRERMKGKPVIVLAQMDLPAVPAEFEAAADAILVHYGVQAQALLDIVTGKAEPSALLPVGLPKDMDTVEEQSEDVPFDAIPYTDTCGNTYRFGFGLNWSGVIEDERTRHYNKER